MSIHAKVKRLTAPEIYARKGQVPLVCLTAYTAPVAEILDEHCDVLLVGDSVGMVVHGLPSTIGVTMDMMILHAQAVMRGSDKAFVVVDMPFGSYEAGQEQAFHNAARLLKETGAQAVKIESGPTVHETVAYLVQRGIPVMGHVGLRPQAVNVDGGFKAKGRTEAERKKVIQEALDTDAAGAFAIVVEGVAEDLAREITVLVKAPTIGIGASAGCDGQVLVTDDMLGLFDWSPKFVRRYADMRGAISKAAEDYAKDVRDRSFPAPQETYFAK
ncbi:3-methyl-2-oxobutanoate hydroxymethyltransferase [Asticcacaulis sp. ZE23SCel15]|uniref:3-methyl-2-oxobutanoate hydroxymethyltransferase n=1 Tax=Asticcacaulis sp. ZE23SCel15 TaxID=3059027 RepID=UPI00265E8E26|nr:3-methyl-2-oxobutanoate hydroxymethyltransferase [Asticcacaulis sp. ZE23SCel15]WKL56350.1 3-methyl-2-oxobutanoate hydroxymethyltransferase [Asticcacaulis sp. ZE23SCel15]